MIFDTVIFIWVQRANEKAERQMEKSEDRFISIQSYLPSQARKKKIRDFKTRGD